MENTLTQYTIPRYQITLVREDNAPTRSIPKILNSSDAVPILRAAIPKQTDREHFLVATLDIRNHVIGVNIVSTGSLSGSLVHPREVYKLAILQNAASIIVCHNHPSGDPAPSREDRDVTQRLREAGGLLGIGMLDHVILGDDSYYSFDEEGQK